MMKRFLKLASFAALTSLTFGFNLQTAYELVHVPERTAVEGEDLELEAIFSGDVGEIGSAKILYRLAGQVGYLEEPMSIREMKLVGTIPGETVGAPAIEYVIVVNTTDGGLLAYPQDDDPLNNPVRVAVEEKSGVLSDGEGQGAADEQLVILTPDPGAIVPFGEPVLVAVSLFNLQNVDINSVKVFFDNVDVSAYSLITTDLVTYQPDLLSAGRHSIYVEVSNIYGVRLAARSWNVIVQSQAQQLFSVDVHGTMGLSNRTDQINLVSTTVDSVINGDTVAVDLYSTEMNQVQRFDFSTDADFAWAKVRLTANLTSKEDSTLQPQNRYGIRVRNSWLRYTYGDATPMVNRLGLWGKRVRGHSLDVRLKWVNLQLVKGQTNRSVTGTASYDSLSGEWQRKSYTFERGLYGIRPSFGSGNHFQFGLFYVHSRDSVNSVQVQPAWFNGDEYFSTLAGVNEITTVRWGDSQVIHEGDTTDVLYALRGTAPEDNVVMGSDLRLAFDNRRLVLESSIALSLYNRNILDGALTRTELDTFGLLADSTLDDTIGTGSLGLSLGTIDDLVSGAGLNFLLTDGQFDPGKFSDIFVLNENMTLPVDADKLGSNVLAGLSALAIRFSARFNYFNNFISADYHHIGPSYRAFGNPVLRTDRTGWNGWKFTDKVRLLNNLLYLNLGWENYSNNTASLNEKTDPRDTQKSFTGGFTLNPGQGLPTITTNLKYYTRDNNVDTLNVDADGNLVSDPRELNNTLTSNLSLTYVLQMATLENTISLNVMNSSKEDAVEGRTGSLRSARLIGLNVRTEFGIPLITNIMLRSNANQQYEQTNEQYNSNQFLTLGASAGYRLFHDRLNLRSGLQSISFTKESFGTDPTSQLQMNVNFDAQYKIPELSLGDYTIKHRVIGGVELRNYSGDYFDYTDRLYTLKYDLIF